MIAYEIGSRLYLNITNKCTAHAGFVYATCLPVLPDMTFALKRPQFLRDNIRYRRSPCLFGDSFLRVWEPLIRLDTVKAVASWVKAQGIPVRVDTNGLANLFHGRNIRLNWKAWWMLFYQP